MPNCTSELLCINKETPEPTPGTARKIFQVEKAQSGSEAQLAPKAQAVLFTKAEALTEALFIRVLLQVLRVLTHLRKTLPAQNHQEVDILEPGLKDQEVHFLAEETQAKDAENQSMSQNSLRKAKI